METCGYAWFSGTPWPGRSFLDPDELRLALLSLLAEPPETPMHGYQLMKRLEEHIRYADAHGALVKVDRYLRGLPENEWAHLSDFGRTASGANASDGADELEG